MSKDFESVGIMELAASKKSLKITFNKLPNTIFTYTFYVSAKNTEAVLAGRKPTVTVVRRLGKQRAESCEVHKDM